ncbi:hypothetical protein DPMN_109011 [Dreissena polymorpha]|uniref:Uncharacterized protein n=1 Tax=Dreissena polymorpha TaxID=45954 RepID=A0A9D4K9V2_DREPO|nr:hypothetical protein DPMN_109011 [Dreissena polymorpha]
MTYRTDSEAYREPYRGETITIYRPTEYRDHPSISTLSKETGISRKVLRRATVKALMAVRKRKNSWKEKESKGSPRRPNRVITRRIAVALSIDPRNDAESVLTSRTFADIRSVGIDISPNPETVSKKVSEQDMTDMLTNKIQDDTEVEFEELKHVEDWSTEDAYYRVNLDDIVYPGKLLTVDDDKQEATVLFMEETQGKGDLLDVLDLCEALLSQFLLSAECVVGPQECSIVLGTMSVSATVAQL